MNITFFVPGIPSPGGSKRAFHHRHTGKIVIVDMGGAKTKAWRKAVALEATATMASRSLQHPWSGAIVLTVTFYMPRPKCHYGTGRNADKRRDDAPQHHTQAPDATKLLRSTEDALKGIVWVDDSQVVEQYVLKRWADVSQPGARITIIAMED